MDGSMDHTQLMQLFQSQDRFARFVGIQLESMAEGYALASLELTEEHTNGLGIAHGGAVFSLADLAFAAASNSHGQAAVAITATISFLKAVRSGRLQAEAREISQSGRLATYAVEVRDDEGHLCAAFQGTVYRKKEPLLPDSSS